MNIKFILLSLCLTVKVPNIKSLFIPPVAIAKTAKGYVNAIGILGTYTAVSDQIEDKAGQVLDYIDEFQVFAKDLAYGLNDQLTLVDMSVKKNTGAILSEFKMLDISNSIMQLHNNIDLLASKVQDFAENKTAMVEFLVIFISIYELLDLDNNLVDKLDALLKNHKTLMNVFTEIFRMHKAFSITKIRQSTRKFIDEYYLSLMVAIEKNHNLITIVYNLYYGNGGDHLVREYGYYEKKTNGIIRKLLLSWKKATNLAYDRDDYAIFANLKDSVQDVRFKNLLQTHFATEVSLKGHCQGTCKDIQRKVPYNDKYCKGSLHFCYDVLDFFQEGTVVYSSHSERIYQRYSIEDTFYGILGAAFSKQRVKMDQKRVHQNHKTICEQCRCTCDQQFHKKTVRSFYAGKMKPDRPEDVITGVRFSDLNKTIYLEIEVGQLLPMGLINSSTVHWQGPPVDLVSNVLTFNFTIFAFHLDKIHIKRGFLSGFQIFLEEKAWRLRVFSKLFESFVEGIVSEREEIHHDSDKHKTYILTNKNVMVSKRPGRISTNENYKILFGTSNQISDAGQSIVPYFDATNITFEVKAPLGGIGFFHHTSSVDYAGYIRPIIYSVHINYRDIFNPDDYY